MATGDANIIESPDISLSFLYQTVFTTDKTIDALIIQGDTWIMLRGISSPYRTKVFGLSY